MASKATDIVVEQGDASGGSSGGQDEAAKAHNNDNSNNDNTHNNNNSGSGVNSGSGSHPVVVVAAAERHKVYKTTPLPMRQLVPMTFVLLNESLCMNMLQPFVGLLIARLQDKPPEEAGYLSGTLVSVFMLGQVLSAHTWGWLSDQYGRRLPLITGLFTSGMAILMFGLSTRVWVALLARFLHGLFNGNILVAKTMMADITDRTNEARGFAFVSFCGAIGLLLGPALGGLLYDPAASASLRWLHIRPDGLLGSHPALLPSAIVACYSFVGVLVCTFFVQESNPKAKPLPLLLRYLMPCFLRSAQPFVHTPLQEVDASPAGAAGGGGGGAAGANAVTAAATTTTAATAASSSLAAASRNISRRGSFARHRGSAVDAAMMTTASSSRRALAEDARAADGCGCEEIADFASVSFCASFFDGQLALQPCRERSTYVVEGADGDADVVDVEDDDDDDADSDDDDDSLSYSDADLRALPPPPPRNSGTVTATGGDGHNVVTAASPAPTSSSAYGVVVGHVQQQQQQQSSSSSSSPPRDSGVGGRAVSLAPATAASEAPKTCEESGEVIVVRASGDTAEHAAAPLPPPPQQQAQHVVRKFGYKEAFQRQQTRHMLVSYMLLSGGDVILKQCLSLWAIAAVSVGGLSYGSDTVGYVLLINSLPLFAANYTFHWAFARYSNKIGLYRLGLACSAVAVLVLPYTHYIRLQTLQFVCIVLLTGMQQFFMSWCYSLITLLTARAAPPGHVGSIMGINQSCAATTRGLVPFFVTPLFAWSIAGQHIFPFNFMLVFVLSFALYMLCWVTEYNIRSDAAGQLHMVNGQLTLTRLRRVVRRITR